MTSEALFATGVFEGEGSIVLMKHARSVALVVSMTDLDVIERLQAVWGGTIYERKQQDIKWKKAWRWQLGKKSAVYKVLESMLPYLGERRACKALDALDHLDGC